MILKLKNIFPQLKTLKPIILSIIIFSLFVFSACSDDPVTPQEPEFDPPRFDWRSMEIPGNSFAGMWSMDTNNIYLVNNSNNSFYHVSNGNINFHNFGNYGINEIEGISNNEIYLFGAVPFPDNNLTLIKWNGAGFEYYPTGIIVNSGPTIRGCIVNSTEVWIGSMSGLSRFNGATNTNYSYENPNLYLKDLFLSTENKVQYISERWLDTSTVQQSLYEFRDTGFVRIYDETLNPFPAYSSLSQIGGAKYGLKLNIIVGFICINNFTVSSFKEYFCFNDMIITTALSQSNNPVGIHLQDFISVVEVRNTEIFEPGYRSGIIHWNGGKPSSEVGLSSGSNVSMYERLLLHPMNKNTYLVLEPPNPSNRILYIGTRK